MVLMPFCRMFIFYITRLIAAIDNYYLVAAKQLLNTCSHYVRTKFIMYCLTWACFLCCILHRFLAAEQAANVREVKRYKNGFIMDPICLTKDHTVSQKGDNDHEHRAIIRFWVGVGVTMS